MATENHNYPEAALLASVDWLAGRLGDANLRVLDARPDIPQLRSGYAWGHIPGAVSLDLGAVFNGRASGVAGSLGPPAEVAALLGHLGLSRGNSAVVYDGQGGVAAAQAFWLLELFGFQDVRLLEGGFAAWQLAGLPVSAEEPGVESAEAPVGRPVGEWLTTLPVGERLANLDWLLDRLGARGVALVDTRTPAEYSAGHIPGAALLPWEENLEEHGPIARFRDAAELRRHFEASGVTPDKTVVTYCQTGARSAHTYFTLRLLGYPQVRNYDGSWQEWSALPDTPKER